jgi:ribosomal protein L40E
MPIKFKCACGATLQAKDEQAGKRTKCPNCQQVVAIPRPASASAPKPGKAELALDEEPGKPTCPHCGAALPPSAVICVKCGYNTQTGRAAEEAQGKPTPTIVFPDRKSVV